jgi:hypothetical protein
MRMLKLLLLSILFVFVATSHVFAVGSCNDLLEKLTHEVPHGRIAELLGRTESEIARVEFEKLRGVTKVTILDGTGHSRNYLANDNELFVQFINYNYRRTQDYVEKANWYEVINELGLGPRFRGIVEDQGEIGLIMQNMGRGDEINGLFNGTLSVDEVSQMRRMLNRLFEARIIPYDLQFYRHNGNVMLFDPESYSYRGADYPVDIFRSEFLELIREFQIKVPAVGEEFYRLVREGLL